MWQLIVEGLLLGGDYIYHRYLEDHPGPRKVLQEVAIPRTDVGAPVPLIFGKVRANAPQLAWEGPVVAGPGSGVSTAGTTADFIYGMDMLFVLGIPYPVDGGGNVHVHGMWAGEKKLTWVDFGTQTGDGGFINTQIQAETTLHADLYVSGVVQWFNGRDAQVFVDGAGVAQNFAGQRMQNAGTANERITSYRGVVSAFLHNFSTAPWYFGTSATVPAHSFEVSSYVSSLDASLWPATYVYAVIGEDDNPMNALYRLITVYYGTLGLGADFVDLASFNAAAITLAQEGHGYSRYISDRAQARNHIVEILTQVDGALYIDPSTGKLGIKLIRPDYDPTTIQVIDKTNCTELTNLAISSWEGLPTHVMLTYTKRADNYRPGLAEASNQVNAVGQSGQVQTIQMQMPGICTQATADLVAERELAALSRPLMKCTAIADRSLRNLKQGDPVMVRYSGPDISGIVFRVANINRATTANGSITIDLVQDVFWTWRNRPPITTGLGGHDADGSSGLTLG